MRKIILSIMMALVTLSASAITKPQGTGAGLFQINDDGDFVWVSTGNLQYQATTNTFRFAPNQYDTIGALNSNIGASYSGWIDLFGYGTSGYDANIAPYKSELDLNGYGNGTEDIAGTNYDWGVNNKISNGGNEAGIWRTLTHDEWYYLIMKHYHYQSTVNGVTGLIVLPDEFEYPEGSEPLSYSAGKFNENVLSAAQWTALEDAGAIFLPAAGERTGAEVDGVGVGGFYWSATTRNESSTWAMVAAFEEGKTIITGYSQPMAMGFAVRLVADRVVKKYNLTVNGLELNELNLDELSNDGSIVFDPNTRELTLTDVDLLANPSESNVISATEAISVVLVGINRITTTTGSVFDLAEGSVIKGEGELIIESREGASRSQLALEDDLEIAGTKTYATDTIWITTVIEQPVSPAFSVAADKTVLFAFGNLQYSDKFDLWRIADTTYVKPSEEADPIKGKWEEALMWREDWSDILVYNSDKNSQWRMLSADEWQYLLFERDNALYKFSYGSIEGRYGLMILPDAWTLPTGLSFVVYPLLPTTPSEDKNSFSAEQWAQMEAAGAVFVPYYGNTAAVSLWLPDEENEDEAYYFFAKWGQLPNMTATAQKNDWNHYVRLVKDGPKSEGIGDTSVDSKAAKRIVGGRLLIECDGKTFNAQGVEVK